MHLFLHLSVLYILWVWAVKATVMLIRGHQHPFVINKYITYIPVVPVVSKINQISGFDDAFSYNKHIVCAFVIIKEIESRNPRIGRDRVYFGKMPAYIR